mmetsp:Transcript_6819/g.9949  ORF Transcript_6819/g.9949 Transcript_6819/m.9949 type:complete len:516 (+) Transcript_6819:271-1818(+)
MAEDAKNENSGLSDMHLREPIEEIYDHDAKSRQHLYKHNIENYIGTVKIPLGIAGPVRVNGHHANGDYYIPLATTEAALVASISRGISVINQSGGAASVVVQTGINRDPCLQFESIIQMGEFIVWAQENYKKIKTIAESTTRHGKLINVEYVVDGRDVHMRMSYYSADASGQNMVTIATEKVVEFIKKEAPVKPFNVLLEGGASGDKKHSVGVLRTVRGKRVTSEVVMPSEVVERVLHCSPEKMAHNTGIGLRGLALNGTPSHNLHLANALTAMSIALGQDPACAGEMSIGICKIEITKNRDVYASITLPNLLCGTVGGGTKLPSQLACLRLMGLAGKGKAYALAEVMSVVCLAGEISLGSAVSSDDFARAHQLLARPEYDSQGVNVDDSIEDQFNKAQSLLLHVENFPSKDKVLKIYGLYKQATIGDINISKPSAFSFDLRAKAKYSAWKSLKGTSEEDAMKQYIDLVLEVTGAKRVKGTSAAGARPTIRADGGSSSQSQHQNEEQSEEAENKE